MSTDPGERPLGALDVGRVRTEQCGREEVPQHDPGAVVELLAEVRPHVGDALAPALGVVGLHPHDDAALLAHLPEAGPERANERQFHEEQLDGADPVHSFTPGTSA
jgi:hypothetical protein